MATNKQFVCFLNMECDIAFMLNEVVFLFKIANMQYLCLTIELFFQSQILQCECSHCTRYSVGLDRLLVEHSTILHIDRSLTCTLI